MSPSMCHLQRALAQNLKVNLRVLKKLARILLNVYEATVKKPHCSRTRHQRCGHGHRRKHKQGGVEVKKLGWILTLNLGIWGA